MADLNMLKIAICDDDKKDIDVIQGYIMTYLQNHGISHHLDIFESGELLLQSKNEFDLVFLDIEMKGISGIQAGNSIRNKNSNVKIIYTTNFPKYWMLAFNSVHAFAYLRKPIKLQDIETQMNEVWKHFKEQYREEEKVGFEILKESAEYGKRTEYKKFSVENIYYFEYINRKIKIKSVDGEYFFIGKMKDVIEKMNTYEFGTCHQCYLINFRFIDSTKGYDLYLKNGEKIPISQKRSSYFRAQINQFVRNNI